MPPAVANHPYYELQFDKQGAAAGGDPAAVAAGLTAAGVADVFVIAHGWNNNADEARSLYGDLFGSADAVLAGTPMAGRPFGVVGVFWPSKRFDDRDLVPAGGGGALSLADAGAPLAAKLEGLKGVFSALGADAKLAEAQALVGRLEVSPVAQRRFGELVLDVMRGAALERPVAPQNEDNAANLLTTPGDEILAALGSPPPASGPGVGGAGGAGGGAGGIPGMGFRGRAGGGTNGGGAADGQAAGLGDLFGGIAAGARNLLNYATYYEMKNRAGIVGRGGVYAAVRALREASPGVRVHLVGHSFGARVVTAAADGPAGTAGAAAPALMPHSMMLLQGAYSHYGLASRWDGDHDGLFRNVLAGRRVDGPMAVTHTNNDKAVGVAYAIASRLANQVAASIGGPDDKYGGIGRNGAQKTPEADSTYGLGPVGTAYAFARGRVYNLNADAYISGHSDVRGREVAHAMLSAAGAGLTT